MNTLNIRTNSVIERVVNAGDGAAQTRGSREA